MQNESLKNELLAIKSKYSFLTQFVQSAEERLHATNQQKQNMEDFIYRQCKYEGRGMTGRGRGSCMMVLFYHQVQF